MGRLLLYRAQEDPSDTVLYKDVLSLLVTSTRDESSEVRRRALSAIKAVAKVWTWTILPSVEYYCYNFIFWLINETLQANPSAIMSHGTVIGPALAECLKDANTPVRLAAERCAIHAFQLTKGTFTCIFAYALYLIFLHYWWAMLIINLFSTSID